MAQSNMFKPTTSDSGLGQKSMDKGQFANPPQYTDVARMTASSVKDEDGMAGTVQKAPTAKKGRV